MLNENEIWKDIPGYENQYQASTLGRIRSLTRQVYNYTKPGRVLKQNSNGHFYMYVSLNGKKHYVHRLVATTFLNNLNKLREVNHLDFNKLNNKISNLEWVTSAQNKVHYKLSKYSKETYEKKIKNLTTKTIKRILENKEGIFKLWKQGYTIEKIAKELKIGRDFVSQVLEVYKEFLKYV